MDISALQPHLKASAIPFDQLAGNPNISQDDKVKEACRQFEAILLRQILGEARKTVITGADGEDSNEKGIYDDMVNNQLADSISMSGSFGLAKSLEGQLLRQVEHKHGNAPEPTVADTSPAKTWSLPNTNPHSS